ncbi:hypothetical protein [Paraburkholderia bannensis]|uniref:hypothetical protein n=1 Tax=Paraburkholderia bannensis TaxID=765414 RepID=UPI00048311E1|nr:hypothetical protein [Paraburkholderia bannensis]
MSYASLAADAERMAIPLWLLPYERRGKKTAEKLRVELIRRLLGPAHEGFRGKLADIDEHLSRLVDCSQGRHGRALQIALTAYETSQRNAAELAKRTVMRRPNRKEVLLLEADVRQWAIVSRAGFAVYRAARAVRGEDELGILPLSEAADSSQPWPVPRPAPANAESETLVAASHKAVDAARIEVDTAPRRPLVLIPGYEHCTPKHTAPQRFVAELERFITRLESEIGGKAETVA